MEIVKKKTTSETIIKPIEKALPKLAIIDEVIIGSEENDEVLRQFEYIVENNLIDGLNGPIDIKVSDKDTITFSDISYVRTQ